jgi:hypothetical protein
MMGQVDDSFIDRFAAASTERFAAGSTGSQN